MLAELRDREGEARALEQAIRREREQARPEREVLEALGSCYMKALAAQLGGAESRFIEVRQQRRTLREKQEALQQQRITAEREQAAKSIELQSVESFFTDRDRQRDRLRQDGVLEPKEEAAAALERWQTAAAQSVEAAARSRAERNAASSLPTPPRLTLGSINSPPASPTPTSARRRWPRILKCRLPSKRRARTSTYLRPPTVSVSVWPRC